MSTPIESQAGTAAPQVELPEGDDVLIIVPLRETVFFPGMVLPLSLGRPASLAAVQEALRTGRKIGLLRQTDREVERPGREDLVTVGTEASVLRYLTGADGVHHVVCQGEGRFRVLDFVEGLPFLVARIERLAPPAEPPADTPELAAKHLHLRNQVLQVLELLPGAPPELATLVRESKDPGRLADTAASFIDLEPGVQQELLETVDPEVRVDKVLEHVRARLDVLRLARELESETRRTMGEEHRKHMLREQLRAIRRELGEDEGSENAELAEAIGKAGMPREAEEAARKELRRLERMSEAAGEHAMLRTWLDWMVSLPWSKLDEEHIDIERARTVLDEDHHGLEKVKRRILEFLAVRKLNPEGHGPILCLVGPPGVGKTSIGRSVARALGLEFVRLSLGGVHDEAEIRGHRRTYVGAMPGNVVQSLKKADSRNPVFMLDEVDKLGSGGVHGDPASALLEVLDPEQNDSFKDNYLGVAFDLSRVLFIATANVLDAIPGPLRDRMEVIEIPGYTAEEKLVIAQRHLLARQLRANGLGPEQVTIDDEALMRIIRDYTREAGVRNLERELAAVLRSAAVRIAAGEAQGVVALGADDVVSVLGPARYEPESRLRTAVPGVATGLAWTPVGGDLLFIEASQAPGKGQLLLTGQLGEVMRESAQAALSLVKARAGALGLESAAFAEQDIHIHVPAGAIPKDGPSAGVAMFTALVSLLTGRVVRNDVAMTGEISLRGLVLPVGGIKEKCLAAAQAGLRAVLLPARNRKDLEEIPAAARAQLEFVWLDDVEQLLEHAFEPQAPARPARRSSARPR